jgi:hypothetical protein
VTEIIITVRNALRPGGSYRLRATNLRGLMGTARDSERQFTMPNPPRPATATPPPSATPPPTGAPPPILDP